MKAYIADEQINYDSPDTDMVFCQNLRENNIFIFVDNLEEYGYIIHS